MNRLAATACVLFGGTLMSFIGLLLRMMEQADGIQVLIVRSSALILMVWTFACISRKVTPMAVVRAIDHIDWIVGALLAVAFSFYVYAILNTNVASALFILSSSPIFAVVLGWLMAGEKPSRVTLVAIALAVVGVAVMVYDGFETGGVLGNLYAMFSALCFAIMLVVIRKYGSDTRADGLGGTMLGGALAVLLNLVVALTYGKGLVMTPWDAGLSLIMGAFTIGLGISFVTLATSYLPASEVSILILIESVLAPVWVWLALDETTSVSVLVGGAIVLIAVILQASRGGVVKEA